MMYLEIGRKRVPAFQDDEGGATRRERAATDREREAANETNVCIYTHIISLYIFERESERTQKRQKEGEAINEVIAEKENEREREVFFQVTNVERGDNK